jgi:hypothetical protein
MSTNDIFYECLFVLFIAAWAIFQLSGGCHHYRWLGCKFRPMLGAQGLWAGRDLYRATPTATRDLGLYCLIRKTGTHVPQWGLNPQLKDHQIFEPDALSTAPRRRPFEFTNTINMLQWNTEIYPLNKIDIFTLCYFHSHSVIFRVKITKLIVTSYIWLWRYATRKFISLVRQDF